LNKVNVVCNAVKKKLVPSPRLKRAVESRAEEIRRAIERQCDRANLSAEARLDGSVAKDTWIRGLADVDIFMRVSPDLTKQQLREICLPIAKKALEPFQVIERYAEHPYVEATVPFGVDSLKVNVVPCYRVEKGNWLSATDRTPYHTEYIRTHMTDEQRDEVRLLKAFMRGVGAYGADIKTGGFSGMLCETLALHYGKFPKVVEGFTTWRESSFIDLENYYAERDREIRRIFREPLVVIDPVDRGRNLAAAVRAEQLWNFVSASRYFTENPSEAYFFEPKTKPLRHSEYERLIKDRGSVLLCIAAGRIDAVVDILWSQLYRTERALVHFLENNEFNVIRTTSWSDEKGLNVLLFELETEHLPHSRRHEGPPVWKLNESFAFLSKHLMKGDTVCGPWIERERWIVQKERTETSARRLLRSALRSGGADLGVASLLAKSFRRRLRILDGKGTGTLVSRNLEFAKFMRRYLSGRPVWIA